jgi:DNA invertase Pin-like site-specific DNA recombinase
VLPALYDDGGFSGGTMERPALKRLIADIQAGQIDVVVVYKVNRLTRASPILPSSSRSLTAAASPSYRSPSNSTPQPAWDG